MTVDFVFINIWKNAGVLLCEGLLLMSIKRFLCSSVRFRASLYLTWEDLKLKQQRKCVMLSSISFPAVCGGCVELWTLHVAAGSDAASGLELFVFVKQGNCWHGEEIKKMDYILTVPVFQSVKCLLLPFPPQSMETMFEWEDEDEDKEDKVELWLNSCTFSCNFAVSSCTQTLIFCLSLSGVRAQGLHG